MIKPIIDCSSKKLQHSTERHAIKHILRMNVKKTKVLVPYLCKECQYWHIGHINR